MPGAGLVPNMERLAKEGILFDQAHVPNACADLRANP